MRLGASVADFVASAAACFVGFGGSDEDDGVVVGGGFAFDDALGVACGSSALDADGAEFDDFVGDGHELGHGAEGLSSEVLIESGADDFFSLVGPFDGALDDALVEELGFFDADEVGFGEEELVEFGQGGDGDGGVGDSLVGDDHLFVVAAVDGGFEDLDLFFGVEGSSGSSDEFFAFPSVHASADDGELAGLGLSFGHGFWGWAGRGWAGVVLG